MRDMTRQWVDAVHTVGLAFSLVVLVMGAVVVWTTIREVQYPDIMVTGVIFGVILLVIGGIGIKTAVLGAR